MKTRKHFTPEEDQKLKLWDAERIALTEQCHRLCRTVGSVTGRRKRLGFAAFLQDGLPRYREYKRQNQRPKKLPVSGPKLYQMAKELGLEAWVKETEDFLSRKGARMLGNRIVNFWHGKGFHGAKFTIEEIPGRNEKGFQVRMNLDKFGFPPRRHTPVFA